VREDGAAAWARGQWIVYRYRYRYEYRVLFGHQNGSPGIPWLSEGSLLNTPGFDRTQRAVHPVHGALVESQPTVLNSQQGSLGDSALLALHHW